MADHPIRPSGAQTAPETQARVNHQNREDADARRAREFARALARAVFGRHYWDEKMQRERNAASQTSKKQRPRK